MSPDYFDLNSQQHRLQLTIQGTVQGFNPITEENVCEYNFSSCGDFEHINYDLDLGRK